MSDASWRLDTSLQRLGHEDKYPERNIEASILLSFKSKAPANTLPVNASWLSWLTLAQHFGCPTRLLDFSESALVALYFATEDESDDTKDGAIWCVQPYKCSALWPDEAKRKLHLDENAPGVSTLREEQLSELTKGCDEPKAFFKKIRDIGDTLLFIEPPHLDSRVRAQHHVYCLATHQDRHIQKWLEEKDPVGEGQTYHKIIIPAARKREFREKLSAQLGVRSTTIKPDLDALGKELRKKYLKRAAEPGCN